MQLNDGFCLNLFKIIIVTGVSKGAALSSLFQERSGSFAKYKLELTPFFWTVNRSKAELSWVSFLFYIYGHVSILCFVFQFLCELFGGFLAGLFGRGFNFGLWQFLFVRLTYFHLPQILFNGNHFFLQMSKCLYYCYLHELGVIKMLLTSTFIVRLLQRDNITLSKCSTVHTEQTNYSFQNWQNSLFYKKHISTAYCNCPSLPLKT